MAHAPRAQVGGSALPRLHRARRRATPSFAAVGAARWAACPTSRPARSSRSNACRAGTSASTIVLSPSTAAPRPWMPSRPARSAFSRSSASKVSVVAERTPRLAEAATEQRPGRAADAVDQGAADARSTARPAADPSTASRSVDRRREAPIHVDAVVGVADRRVELREVVTVRREDVGALADPPPHGGAVQRRMRSSTDRHSPVAPSDRPISVSTRHLFAIVMCSTMPNKIWQLSRGIRSYRTIDFARRTYLAIARQLPRSPGREYRRGWSPRCSSERWSARRSCVDR